MNKYATMLKTVANIDCFGWIQEEEEEEKKGTKIYEQNQNDYHRLSFVS